MKVAITGASGFIGRRLLKLLLQRGHSLHVLSRHAGTNLPPGIGISVWDALKGPPPLDALRGANAVVHLAGEPVAQKWTTEAKSAIRESRVTGTRHLVEAMSQLDPKPALLCASAIGYYGARGDAALDEGSPAGSGFLADLCVDWEREAFAASAAGARVAVIRTGIVLDPRGGALQRMLPPFRLGLGGPLGNGKQWMSWIHLEDLVGIYIFALEKEVSGAFNGTAPNPATNAEFTRELAGTLHRPAFLPVPKLPLKLAFGEMAGMLFDSQRVLPKQTQSAGFDFRYPRLDAALKDLLR